MDFSASAATKDAARLRRRRFCTPPRFFSTLPHTLARLNPAVRTAVGRDQPRLPRPWWFRSA
jgi:hypothetical protein